MSKVLVDREWLKQLHRDLDACQKVIWSGLRGADPAYCQDAQVRLKEIDELLAQPEEVEGVEAVEFWVLFDATTPEPYIKKMMPEGFLAFFDHEGDAIRAKTFHLGTDYKRVPYVRQSDHLYALSSVTDERDIFREQRNDLADMLEGLHDSRDQLRAEVEALREVFGECIQSLHDEMLQGYSGQKPDDMHPVTRRNYDRDMAEITEYRAAMSAKEPTK